jgi:hypothetical protein
MQTVLFPDLPRATVRVDFEPGNATRYQLLLVHERSTLYTFVWLNAPGHGRACTLSQSGVLHAGYLAEKLGYDKRVDLNPILGWLESQGFTTHISGE